MPKTLHIYTDGGLRPQANMPEGSGLGGVGVVVLDDDQVVIRRYWDHFNEQTTNQRMELSAIICGLELVNAYYPDTEVVKIYSDSAYAVNCIKDDWWYNWILKHWRNSANQPVSNQDLWRQIIALIPNTYHVMFNKFGPKCFSRIPDEEDVRVVRASQQLLYKVEFIKVKGHSGNIGNDLADELATLGKNGESGEWVK